MVRELLGPGPGSLPFRVESVVATGDWLAEFGGSIPGGTEHLEVGAAELRQLSLQQEPNRAMAIVHQLAYTPDIPGISEGLSLTLENIQDPGNLGTIVRIADWFGIRDIFCSEDSAELYNPKVIQSTMGSFLRVRVHYLDIGTLIQEISSDHETAYQVFATGSLGENLYRSSLPEKGMILLGNESRGLSETLMDLADLVISIPPHDPSVHAESLNVASAAVVLCAEFRRQSYSK